MTLFDADDGGARPFRFGISDRPIERAQPSHTLPECHHRTPDDVRRAPPLDTVTAVG
jgi:hypothetical protein